MSKVTKVLIVEDSDVVREKIKELLSELENVTVVAETDSSAGAIELGMLHKPDVIILDLKLIGSDTGFTVLRKLKKIHPDMVTIVISNYNSVPYRRKLMELGADYFFDKSNEFDEIVKVFSWV